MKRVLLSLIGFSIVGWSGFFPSEIHSSVIKVENSTITMSKPFPIKGMSGIVIHNFGKGLSSITSIIVNSNQNRAQIEKGDLLNHKGLPTPKNKAVAGDKVIGGYLYSNVLVIAPNAQTYTKITHSSNKHWISPDLYAAFLSREGDKSINANNLKKFAIESQVGLIYIVQRGKGVLYDPISQRYISSKKLSGLPSKGQFPFYMRLGKIDSGWFSRDAKGTYYNTIGNLR